MVATQDLLLVEDRTRPIVTMSVSLAGGQLADPPGKEGLAYLTAHMLMLGTTKRSHAELSEDLDSLGSNLGISVNRETTSITGDALTRNLPEFEALVAEVPCLLPYWKKASVQH